jgi:membrane protein DedA with SNARE-associated domain
MIDLFSADTYQGVQEWIIDNPNWAGMAVFTISMCESLAVIGLFIPGIIAMSIIGGLVSADILAIVPTLLWAIGGAIAGDGISYYIGHHFRDHLPLYWPFRRFPQWLERGKSFFIAHGSKSIVIGRFVGPVRPFIPVVAGMMGMKPRTFLMANIFSAIIWAPIYMLPGFSITALL